MAGTVIGRAGLRLTQVALDRLPLKDAKSTTCTTAPPPGLPYLKRSVFDLVRVKCSKWLSPSLQLKCLLLRKAPALTWQAAGFVVKVALPNLQIWNADW